MKIFNRKSPAVIKDVQEMGKKEFIDHYAENTSAKPAVLEKFYDENHKANTPSVKPKKSTKIVEDVKDTDNVIDGDKPDEPIAVVGKKKAAEKPAKSKVDEATINKGKQVHFEALRTFLNSADKDLLGKKWDLQAKLLFLGQGEEELRNVYNEKWNATNAESNDEIQATADAEKAIFNDFGTMINLQISTYNAESSDKVIEKKDVKKKVNVKTTDVKEKGSLSKRDVIRELLMENPEYKNKEIKVLLLEKGFEKCYDSEIHSVRQKI